jgi:hypothetical protein
MKSQMEGGEVAQQPLTLVLIGLLVVPIVASAQKAGWRIARVECPACGDGFAATGTVGNYYD